MHTLRPHRIFELLDSRDRIAAIPLPGKHSLTSMLERAILATLAKIVKPETIFEFGTFTGESTTLLALNSDATVVTLDLDNVQSSPLLDRFEARNLFLGNKHDKVFANLDLTQRIDCIKGDSTRIDLSRYGGRMDFILIDGGHHPDVVRSDTENAFRMLNRKRSACIVWHDYHNTRYRITEYLDALSVELNMYHVEDTSYVYYATLPSLQF